MVTNLVSRTSIQLLLKPLWVNRSSTISYTKGRYYSSSSLPLHKNISEDGKLKSHKGFEPEVQGAQLYNGLDQDAVITLNSCVGCGEGQITTGLLAEEKYIKEQDKLDEKPQCNLMDGKNQTQDCGNRPDAERLAIQLLSRRAFTALELKKKLQGKNFPLDIVDTVVADFQNRGYINDSLYAEAYSRSRFSSSCWGPKRIKQVTYYSNPRYLTALEELLQALSKKGVSKLDTDGAIKLVFEEDESVEEPELVAGISKLSMDHLLVQGSKQWLRSQKVSSEKRKSRLTQWLQYRGYNWNVINFVLKKLESGYVP